MADVVAAPSSRTVNIVLVTGANGFLGRHVVRALLAAGYTVRALVRPDADASALRALSGVDVVEADLIGPNDLKPACAGVDAVIHLAASLQGSDEEQTRVAVDGSQHLLDALDLNRTVRVVLASSFSVYDFSRIGPELTETSALLNDASAAALDGYTRAKVKQEPAVREHCARLGIALTVLRPAAVWGVGQPWPATIGPGSGAIRFVVGPGRALRLTHAFNCASAFVAALDPRAEGETFNVDDGHRLDAWEYTGASSGIEGRAIVRIPLPLGLTLGLLEAAGAWLSARRRGGKLPGLLVPARAHARFHGSRAGHARLTEVLGWRPPCSFAECIERSRAARP